MAGIPMRQMAFVEMLRVDLSPNLNLFENFYLFWHVLASTVLCRIDFLSSIYFQSFDSTRLNYYCILKLKDCWPVQSCWPITKDWSLEDLRTSASKGRVRISKAIFVECHPASQDT